MSGLFWLNDAQIAERAANHGEQSTVMIDATYLKAHRTASSPGVHAV